MTYCRHGDSFADCKRPCATCGHECGNHTVAEWWERGDKLPKITPEVFCQADDDEPLGCSCKAFVEVAQAPGEIPEKG